jgi:hypothetical protein
MLVYYYFILASVKSQERFGLIIGHPEVTAPAFLVQPNMEFIGTQQVSLKRIYHIAPHEKVYNFNYTSFPNRCNSDWPMH